MNNFSEDIIKVIEEKKILPKPRWYFILKSWIFGVLGIFFIIIGALSFAIADYVFIDNDSVNIASVKDIIIDIPYIWFFVLGIFTMLIYFLFRKTRRGYKYTTFLIISGIILISIIFGLILNTLDFGQKIHKYLLSHTSFYDGLIHSREDIEY